MIDRDQVAAILRHVYTAVSVALGVLVILGLKQGDATAIGEAVHRIGDAAATIISAIAVIVPIISAFYAAWAQSPFSKLLWFNRNPHVVKVVTVAGTPLGNLADAIPGDKVTSKEP